MIQILFALAMAAEWSAPVEVRHDEKVVLTYRAAWTGDHVVVKASIQPGWHTFAMDNKQREKEKLAGKPSLGSEMNTVITLSGAASAAGGWKQTAPKDYSKPELRYFGFGFEGEAVFAVPAKRIGGGTAEAALKAQACAENVCKNIEIDLAVPAAPIKEPGLLKGLVPVRP